MEKFEILKDRKCIYLIDGVIRDNDSSFRKS